MINDYRMIKRLNASANFEKVECLDLEEKEFVVLSDKSCHIASSSGKQISIIPSTVIITNRRVIIRPMHGVPEEDIRRLSDITEVEKGIASDCSIIQIRSPQQDEVWIHIPTEKHLVSMTKLLDMLIAATSRSQRELDTTASALVREIDALGLGAFYERFDSIKESIETDPLIQSSQIQYFLSTINPKASTFFKIHGDIVLRSETLWFAIAIMVIILLGLIFKLCPFGCVVSLGIFSLIAQKGVKICIPRNRSEEKKDDRRMSAMNAAFRRRFPVFYAELDRFKDAFHQCISWESPRRTFEILLFLFATTLAFTFLSPALLLFLSTVAFFVIERFNPFGYGSISDIVSGILF